MRECTAAPVARQVEALSRLDSPAPRSVRSPVDRSVLPGLEASASRVARGIALVISVLALATCATRPPGGAPEPRSVGTEQVTQLFDPTAVLQQMGLVTGVGQIPFVGSVHLLAGPTPDTAMAVVALSLESRQLVFQRDGDAFAARYQVEVTLRRGVILVRQLVRDERVVVGTFRETQRSDESVIFQDHLAVPAGAYQLAISVRDRNTSNAGRYEAPFHVPPLAMPEIATPIVVYEATPRTDAAAVPDLLVNPRSIVEYGVDTARFYIEAYGLRASSAVVMSALDAQHRVVWADTNRLDSTGALSALEVAVPPARLSLGRFEFHVAVEGGAAAAAAPFLVAFSGQWVVANFGEVISLLRYFTSADTLHALAAVPPDRRAAAWRKFWHDTDPNPATPDNEALEQYFGRVQAANERFRDEGVPGWVTDRGEVLITLGEPDEIIDRRSEMQGRTRMIVWTYARLQLTLYFVDNTGFGRFRLDPGSRAEFLRAVNRPHNAT
jgi:GWxTD domain-containing protein